MKKLYCPTCYSLEKWNKKIEPSENENNSRLPKCDTEGCKRKAILYTE